MRELIALSASVNVVMALCICCWSCCVCSCSIRMSAIICISRLLCAAAGDASPITSASDAPAVRNLMTPLSFRTALSIRHLALGTWHLLFGSDHKMRAAILRPRRFAVTLIEGELLAVAHGLHTRGRNAQRDEIITRGNGAAFTKRKVVLGGAALVAVAFDRDLPAVELLQNPCVLLQHLLRLGRKVGAVELIKHRLERGIAIKLVERSPRNGVFGHHGYWNRLGDWFGRRRGRRRTGCPARRCSRGRHRARDRRRFFAARGNRHHHEQRRRREHEDSSHHRSSFGRANESSVSSSQFPVQS